MATSSQRAEPQLWRALEAIPGLTATAYEWRGRLGADYEWAKQYLRASGGKATSYPCPKRPQCGCAHAVVGHSSDDIVAVCRCSPRRCESVKLSGMDIVLYELNRRALGSAVAAALGAKAEEGAGGGLHMTWQVGTYPARPGIDLPLLLTIQSDADEFRSAVQGLLASREGPFVLMAPTDNHWRPEYGPDMARRQARFLPLNDLLVWDGRMVPVRPLPEALGTYLEDVLPPVKDLYFLEKLGKTWRVIFHGDEKTVPHSIGMDYIARLLSTPNTDIHCLELRGALAGATPSPEPADEGDPEELEDQEAPKGTRIPVDAVADDEAVGRLKKRIRKVQDSAEQAKELGNAEEASKQKEELHKLTMELSRVVGYGGIVRRGSGPTKNAQQSVSKAIRSALKSINGIHPDFGAHLKTALHLGDYFRYRAGQDVRWMVRK